MTDYYFYPYIALTGGADGALDSLDGSSLKDGDAAFVVIPSTQLSYIYTLDADSAASESSPTVIAPDSNAGDKRWIMTGTTSLDVISFLQTGTSAVSRTSLAKMKESSFSVKDFGATGNGTTDDSTAIQAAITAGAALGMPIFVPPGTYNIGGTSLSLPTGTKLFGAGQSVSIFKKSTDNSNPAITVAASGKSNVYIGDLGIYYSLSTYQTSGNHAAILVSSATNVDIERVYVYGRFYVGIYILDSISTNVSYCRVWGAVNRSYYAAAAGAAGMRNVKFISCYANGYEAGATTAYTAYGFNTNCFGTGTATDVKFIGCTAENLVSHGFAASDAMYYVEFNGCMVNNVTTGPGFLFQLANTVANQHCGAVDCFATSCVDGFMVVASNYIRMTGCQAVSNDSDGFLINTGSLYASCVNCSAVSNGSDGFVAADTSAQVRVMGCDATTNGAYGIVTGASTTNCIVIGCVALGNSSGEYSIAGTGAINQHNI